MSIKPYHVTPTFRSSDECAYCDEGAEFGQHHHELYVSREGASLHTADELACLLLEDTVDLCEFDPTQGWARDALEQRSRLRDPMNVHGGDGVGGWIEDAEDNGDVQDWVLEAEGKLGDAGFYVSWDDGYVIERIIEQEG